MRWLKKRTNKDGRERWYVCPPRAKATRLPDLPHNHPDFLTAWADAVKASQSREPSARRGSLKAVVITHQASREYRALKASSREQRARELSRLAAAYGDALITTIKRKHIVADLAKLTPGSVSNRLRAWRIVMQQALDMGLIEIDPSRDVKGAPRKVDGFKAWTEDEVKAFREF